MKATSLFWRLAAILALGPVSMLTVPNRLPAAHAGADTPRKELPAGAIVRLGMVPRGDDSENGHSPPATVREIAVSPDGRTIATYGEPGDPSQVRRVLLWNTAEGRLLRAFEADTSPLVSVVFSTDGSRLIAGGINGDGVWIWDVGTGRLVHRLPGGRGPVTIVRETGRLAVVGDFGRNDVIRLYDLGSGEEIQRHVVDVSYKFAFAPKGRAYLSTRRIGDHVLRLTEFDTRSASREFTGLPRQPTAFAMSADHRTLAASAGETDIVWEVASGLEIFRLTGQSDPVRTLAFSPDNMRLATGDADGAVRIWDLATGTLLHTFAGHQGAVVALAFAPDGTRLVSGSTDQTALVWDLTEVSRSTLPESIPDESQRAALWRDLATTAPAPAYRAIGRIRQHDDELVPWLRREVDALLAPVELSRIEQLIGELDHDDFRVRFRATEELRKLREAAHPVLLRVMKQTASAEVRHRLRRLLAAGDESPRFTEADIRRMRRIVHALESLTGPDATAVLERLERDFPSAEVQSAARDALARMRSS